ncbi:MAG: hypothetical protein IJ553_01625 [Alloprevotella sp.]|nr:hypothetical protein [Alloprevotella sp.]
MRAVFGCFLAIVVVFALLVVLLPLIGAQLLFTRLRQPRTHAGRPQNDAAASSHKEDDAAAANRKIYRSDEGEYVDYTEISDK